MAFEWDERKAEANFRKHGVLFPEAEPIFRDDYAITALDEESDPDYQRFVSIGTGALGRVLVVVYCYRAEAIRIISVRLANPIERELYEEDR